VSDLWGSQDPGFHVPDGARKKMGGKVAHVDVAEAADVLVIAPATADLMARLVHGEAPDALTSVALASRAPLIVCPRWTSRCGARGDARQRRALRARGADRRSRDGAARIGARRARAGSRRSRTIVAAVERAARGARRSRACACSSARAHRGAVDPVRVLTNRSSGGWASRSPRRRAIAARS
jgi:phosphopantothenoylcysteine decarboxylase/phosphopantothenate--cysteine ligase